MKKGYSAAVMHLPDPSTFTFGTAIVNLTIALTGIIRLILEKKSKSVPLEGPSKKTHRLSFVR
jgi:hypothetical protein